MTEKFARWLFVLALPLAVLLVACDENADDQMTAAPIVVQQPCDIRSGCVVTGETLSVRASMGPELRGLTPFPVEVAVQGREAIKTVTVAFSMKGMDMGPNSYRLLKSDTGTWRADVTLPICASGRSDWFADFQLLAGDHRYQFQVPFVLGK